MFYVNNYYGRIKTAPSYQKKTTREKKRCIFATYEKNARNIDRNASVQLFGNWYGKTI